MIELTVEELTTIHDIIITLTNEYEFTDFTITKQSTGIGEVLQLNITLKEDQINSYPIKHQIEVNLTNYDNW